MVSEHPPWKLQVSDSGGEAEDTIADDDRLRAIAEAGGIPPLVNLVSGGSSMGKEKSARALCHLALDVTNRSVIVKANGIAPLASLLDLEGGTAETFRYAADALARLSQNDTEHQAQIAKRLVMLLSSDHIDAQVRAARALWDLADDEPDSPVVILNAGALLPLVKMLSSGGEDAQKTAAGALSTLALNSTQNQLAIANGLVALLGGGDDDAQQHVAEAHTVHMRPTPSARRTRCSYLSVRCVWYTGTWPICCFSWRVTPTPLSRSQRQGPSRGWSTSEALARGACTCTCL